MISILFFSNDACKKKSYIQKKKLTICERMLPNIIYISGLSEWFSVEQINGVRNCETIIVYPLYKQM